MSHRHWTDEEMIAALYGVGREDGHPDACADCRQRWLKIRERRASVVFSPELPAASLRAQRLSIDERLAARQSRERRALRPIAVMAVATVFAFAGSLQRLTAPPAVRPATSELQLFEQVFNEVASMEPRSLQPLHGLFEVKQ